MNKKADSMLVRLLVLLILFFSYGTVFAQEDSIASSETTEQTDEITNESTAEQKKLDDAEEEKRKRKLEIGMILTAGVFFLGVFLIAAVLIYGRRVKRQIAAGRTPSEQRDELWYLKNPVDAPPPDKKKDSE